MLQVTFVKSSFVSRLMLAVACLILAGFGQRVEAAASSKIQPEIIWNIPVPFVYGTMIPAAMVVDPANPTVDLVATGIGQVTYTPALNTILHVTGQPVSLTVKFAPTGANNGSYSKAEKTVSVTVTKAPLTVTANATKFYNEVPTAPLVSYSGFKFSDTVAVLTLVPSISHDVTTSSNAGSYPIRVGAGSATDYQIIPTNGIYEVKPAPLTLTLVNVNQIYNGSPRIVTVTTSPTAGIATSVLYNGSNTAPTNAGTYPIIASVTNTNYTGTVSGNLEISKALATVTLSGLTQTYNGAPRIVTAQTTPTGKTVNITYDGATTPPINANSYNVVGTVSDANYAGTTTATLLVKQATATVRLSGLTQTYNGTTRNVTVTTRPANLSHSLTYNGSDIAPINAGSYTVVGTITNPNYIGVSTRTLVVRKARATVSISGLRQTYNGTMREVSVTTVPANLAITLTYAGLPSAPINAGSYPVVAKVVDNNYSGSSSRTLVVRKATASVALSNLLQVYNGDPRVVLAATNPTGLAVVITYNGQATAPINAGRYTVVATINEINYQGRRSRTLVVQKAQATVVLSNLSQVFDYKPHAVSVVTDPSLLNVAVTYNDSSTEPRQVGTYAVIANITDINYVGQATATMSITAAPMAVADDVTTAMSTGLSIPVLANDWIASGGTLSMASFGQATNGVVSLGVDAASLYYQPNAQFTGSDVFYYTISDGLGGTALGYVYVTVTSPADLLLHWKFDEPSGSIARDSARDHDASIYGSYERVEGKSNSALKLGSGGYAITEASARLQIQQMTIAMWIKPDNNFSTMSTYSSLLHCLDYGNNTGFYFGLIGNTNNLYFMLMNGVDTSTSKLIMFEEVTFGQWVHVAAVYDGSNMIMYRNGVQMVSLPVGELKINYSPTMPIVAGSYYDGAIEDVRIYGRALDASELAILTGPHVENAPPIIYSMSPDSAVTLPTSVSLSAVVKDDGLSANPLQLTWLQVGGPAPVVFTAPNEALTQVSFSKPGGYALRLLAFDGDLSSTQDVYVTVYGNDDLSVGLIAHWALDETSGALASDRTGNDLHSWLNGSPVWQAGIVNGGLLLNGSDIGITANASAFQVSTLTISGWIKANKPFSQMAGAYPSILHKLDYEHNAGFYFGVFSPQTDKIGMRIMTDASAYARKELEYTVINPTQWHHLCGVYDGAYMRIYVDGIEVQILRVGPQRINYNFREVLLGEGMEGVLDDVRLYQRALSPSEVNVLAGIALGSSG